MAVVGECSALLEVTWEEEVLRRHQIPRGAQSPQRLRALPLARFFHFKGGKAESQRGRVLDDSPAEQTRGQVAAT